MAWHKKSYRYSGSVTLWNDEDSYLYQTSIKRKRSDSPKPAQPSCNPNYTGVCLPLTGDVDCGDITARDFGSVGSDPFRLDGDGDRIACES